MLWVHLRTAGGAGEAAMDIEVVEFEIVCPEHGVYRVQVPVELPRPNACLHCYHPVKRRELRRYTVPAPIAGPVAPTEAFFG